MKPAAITGWIETTNMLLRNHFGCGSMSHDYFSMGGLSLKTSAAPQAALGSMPLGLRGTQGLSG